MLYFTAEFGGNIQLINTAALQTCWTNCPWTALSRIHTSRSSSRENTPLTCSVMQLYFARIFEGNLTGFTERTAVMLFFTLRFCT